MTATNRPPAARRREEAREAAARLRAEQQRAARRARTIAISALIACLVLFGVVVTVILTSADDDAPAGGSLGEVAAPAGSTEAGAIPVGASGVAGTTEGSDPDAVVVSVYADYLCPFCGLFEETNAEALDEMRASGDVVVEYHPVSILDGLSAGSEYSTRAATAAALVADQSPEAFVAFNHAMYAHQPEENTVGLTDAQIADLAADAGADDAVVAAIADGSYLTGEGSFAPWVAAVTERAGLDLDQLATPAILIDGEQLDPEQYDWRQPGRLEAAVADARG